MRNSNQYCKKYKKIIENTMNSYMPTSWTTHGQVSGNISLPKMNQKERQFKETDHQKWIKNKQTKKKNTQKCRAPRQRNSSIYGQKKNGLPRHENIRRNL